MAMTHTPDDPAHCPKCDGVMKHSVAGAGNVMVCENTLHAPSSVTTEPWTLTVRPSCDQDPMYLVPLGKDQ